MKRDQFFVPGCPQKIWRSLSIIVDATLSPEIKGIMGLYTGKTRESSLFSPSAGRGRDHEFDHTEQYIL